MPTCWRSLGAERRWRCLPPPAHRVVGLEEHRGREAAVDPVQLVPALAGEVDCAIWPVNSVMPHIKTGKLRAIAVWASTRSSILPDTPTIAEAGPRGDREFNDSPQYQPCINWLDVMLA